MTTAQKERQLKALLRKLESGKVTNPYALRGKIDLLRKQIAEGKRRQSMFEYLAR
jgi:polyhydroxyalkanoate synthesis regulator phasin